jgi:hypothetical protein
LLLLPNGELGFTDFFQQVNMIMMILHKKIGQNLVHGFRENPKMVVGEGGLFLKNHEVFSLAIM